MAEKIEVRISDHAGTSFCNALYWNRLDYIHNRKVKTKMLFLHIPFSRNITAADFFERIVRGLKSC